MSNTSIIIEHGTSDAEIVAGGSYISEVQVLSGVHYTRVGDRVSFSVKLRLLWADAGGGNLQIPLPVPTGNAENAKLVAVCVIDGGPGYGFVSETQCAGSPPYLYVALVADAGVTETTLAIHADYLVVASE
jgi:hypothetical protein